MTNETEPDNENALDEALQKADAEEPAVAPARITIEPGKPQNFADELGIVDLSEPVFGGRGRLFSVAGRHAPVAEFTSEFIVLHPPQKPFSEDGPAEVITSHKDSRGVLLDELGREKTIPGARFRGQQLYWLAEYKPGTLKHIAGWIDKQNKAHRLFSEGGVMLVDDVFKLRNRTHDGELTLYPHLSTE